MRPVRNRPRRRRRSDGVLKAMLRCTVATRMASQRPSPAPTESASRVGPPTTRPWLPTFLARALAADERLTRSAMIYWSAATLLGGVFPLLGASTTPGVTRVALAGGQAAALLAVAPLLLGHRRIAQHGFLLTILVTALAVMAESQGQHLGVVVTLVLLPSFALFIGRARAGHPWLVVTIAVVLFCVFGDRVLGWRPVGRFPVQLAGTVSAATVAAYLLQWLNMRAADAQREAVERARRDAEAANRAKSAFLAVVSHELRTPLNGILGLAGMLMERRHDPEEQEMVETIQRSGDALLRIVNDILDMSKIESGHLAISRAPYSVAAVFTSVERLYRANAAERGIHLQVSPVDGVPPWVFGDGPRVRQVIINLVSNALKFTPGGTVRVEGVWAEGRLSVAGHDTGVGMTEAVCARLFVPFYQGEVLAAEHVEGTGLGLAICRELVSRMGGEISVTSAPGVGSRFTFDVDAPEAEAPRLVLSIPAPDAGLPRRVLVVEDNAVNLRVATALLTRMGVTSVTALNGEIALTSLERESFDLVLMDIQMPVLDGLEITRRIRARTDKRREVPIVALTAAVFEDERRAALDAGMDDLVTKPVRADALRRAMISAVASRARRERSARTSITTACA
jgi:signal transduction histidine kinase/AmiR/NasT family two-component response regulator